MSSHFLFGGSECSTLSSPGRTIPIPATHQNLCPLCKGTKNSYQVHPLYSISAGIVIRQSTQESDARSTRKQIWNGHLPHRHHRLDHEPTERLANLAPSSNACHSVGPKALGFRKVVPLAAKQQRWERIHNMLWRRGYKFGTVPCSTA